MKDQLTLDQLIFLLSRVNPKAEVYYDFGNLRPTTFDSYRGDYSEIALGWADHGRSSPENPMTAGDLLKHCQETLFKSFMGYKGGEYEMKPSTPVWVDNWGLWSGTALIGVIDEGWRILLETAYKN